MRPLVAVCSGVEGCKCLMNGSYILPLCRQRGRGPKDDRHKQKKGANHRKNQGRERESTHYVMDVIRPIVYRYTKFPMSHNVDNVTLGFQGRLLDIVSLLVNAYCPQCCAEMDIQRRQDE